MMEEKRVVGKKTMGRRKIAMKKIEKKSSLQVTFSKRRMGLFRKASQLSLVCGAQIAVLVQSPAKKVFAFGHPSVEAVLDRWRRSSPEAIGVEDGKYEYEEALRILEMEKNRVLKEAEARDDFWWDESIDDMELQELEEYLEAMEALQANLSTRMSEMEQAAKNLELDLDQDSDFLDSSRFPFLELDHDQDFDFLNSSRLPFLELDHDQDLGSTSDLDNGFGGGLMQLFEFDHDQDFDVGDWLIQ